MSTPTPPSGSAPALDAVLNWGTDVFATLLAMKGRVLAYLVVGTAIGTAIALSIPNQYTSSAMFIAQGSASLNLPAALQGAAMSLGLDRGNEYSPKFYADLVTSRAILRSAVLHQYRLDSGDSARGANYLEIEGFAKEPPARALETALGHLGARVAASADVRT